MSQSIVAATKYTATDITTICKKFSDGSSMFMKYRQDGTSLEDLKTIINQVYNDEKSNQAVHKIAAYAYETPVYTTEKEMSAAVDTYKSELLMSCIAKYIPQTAKK